MRLALLHPFVTLPRLTIALLVLLAACAHHAPAPEYPPLASAKRVSADGAIDASVSLFRVTYRFAEDGTHASTVRTVYKLLSPEAIDSWGESSARWSPWRMSRPEIRATVTSTTGVVSKLDPSVLSESAAYPEAPAMYGDERTLRGPLPNVAVGSVVDEEVTTRTTKPLLGAAEAHHVFFQVGVPREKVELVVDVPASAPFEYEVREAKVSVSDVRRDGRRIVTFTGGPYEAVRALEPSAPSNVVSWPRVSFSTGSAWRPLAAEYARVVREKTAGASFGDVVAKVVKDSDSPSVKADKLLAWMRARVRYVGVEFGESSIVPRTPAETLRNGYGDCKDQAVLLTALLDAAGLPSRVALLDAGYGESIETRLPGLNVFDHAIVVVPGATPLWIDPTATHARAGELPAGDQGRYALVADADSAGLTLTPVASERANTYRESRQVYLGEKGAARVVETSTATGSIERGLRGTFDAGDKDVDKWLADYVTSTYASSEPAHLEMSSVDDLAAPFRMTVEAKNARVSVASLLSATVDISETAIFGWVPKGLTDGAERRNDFALSVPYEADLAYEIHPPPGFVIDEKPDLGEVALRPATLRRELEERPDGVIVVRYRFVLPKSRWSAREVNDFRRAYAQYASQRVTSLSFVHRGEKLLKSRQIDKAVDVYRKDVQARPNDAAAKMRLANALLGLGFGTTARSLAADAMRLQPNDHELWGYAGYIRGRDTLGRWAMPGWDLDGAIAAYREALRVDPSSLFAATNIGLLLEHNADGLRYRAGSRLDEAVATFDALDQARLAAYDGGGYAENAIYDRMWQGRYEDVRARIAKTSAKKVPAVPSIVAAGMQGGSAAALAEVTRLHIADSERASVLADAADVFVTLRRYPEASALLEAASDSSSNEALRVRAGVLRKTKKVDVAAMPVARPEDVVRKVLAVCALRAPTWKSDLRALASTRDYDGGEATGLVAFCDGIGDVEVASQEVFADVMVAVAALTVDGSDALGYRVTMTTDGGQLTLFVTRERTGYQLRASDVSRGSLGCEALAMQKAGRKEAAIQWLTWAKELTKRAGGDDPLRDGAFVELWADKNDDVDLGAAALCAENERPDATVPKLTAARANATGKRAMLLDYALARTRMDGGADVDRLAAVAQLEKSAPTSAIAWQLKFRALQNAGRFQELRDAAAARLAKDPSDVDKLLHLASAEDFLGHAKEAYAIGERAIATNKGGSVAYNAQAWRSLYFGPTEKDLEYALKAVNAAPKSVAYLNTLAAVEIALGRTADAQEHVARCLELRRHKTVAPSDWYVIGRIAEQLGLVDEAKAAYAKIPKGPKWTGQYTEARLAEMRLAKLK